MVGDITSKECVLLRVKLVNRIGLAFLAIMLLCFIPQAHAAFGFNLEGTLDKAAISHAYFEGEFSRVLPPLEAYRQSFPGNAKKEDSIFVYKYLSVIYAADPKTRQKAESYMVQLIKLMPTIELIDLYISDNIESIFKNVKQSYEQQQAYVRGHDEYGRDKNHGKNGTEEKSVAPVKIKEERSHKWIWWTLGGVGTAAIATTAYFVLNGDHTAAKQPSDFKP